MSGPEPVFPLIPARRGSALDVSGHQSRRRGSDGEIAGSRPYRRGDSIRNVDWAASARLSSARGTDEFVVRETFAEDAVRVVVVVDRSPSMALFPDWLPWLDKQAAIRRTGRMILASGLATNALIGYAAAGATRQLLPARRGRDHAQAIEHHLVTGRMDGPAASLDHSLATLSRPPAGLAPGTFVFVLSDFLPPPSTSLLGEAMGAGWDVVPIVIQDPVWEASFPAVARLTLPLVDPDAGTASLVRLTHAEVLERRAANERRAARLRHGLLEFGLDPVSITRSDAGAVHAAFLDWANRRRSRTRRPR
jgi:uncharacterized protein (DUF58 family)